MTSTATYLYAITHPMDADGLEGLRGVGGAPVRVVTGDGMSCLVSTVELTEFGEEALRANLEDLAWLERTAREHDQVVRAGARLSATVPLRLATICVDDDSTRRRLEQFGETARDALAKIDGRDEWGVKLFSEHRSVDPEPGAPEATSGKAYLLQRRRTLQHQQHSADAVLRRAEDLFAKLGGLAAEARRHRPHDRRLTGDDRPMVLNAAFLVDRRRQQEFRSAVDELTGSDAEVSAVITGPWPAYSFVPEPDVSGPDVPEPDVSEPDA